MKDGFESRLTVVLQKALNENGVNPHGGELARIVDSVSLFVALETEAVVSDPKEVAKVQVEIKAKADAKAKAEAEAKSKPEAPASAPKP